MKRETFALNRDGGRESNLVSRVDELSDNNLPLQRSCLCFACLALIVLFLVLSCCPVNAESPVPLTGDVANDEHKLTPQELARWIDGYRERREGQVHRGVDRDGIAGIGQGTHRDIGARGRARYCRRRRDRRDEHHAHLHHAR